MTFLFKYRNTPTTTTGQAPSELIFQFTPNSEIELLKPQQLTKQEAVKNERFVEKKQFDGKKKTEGTSSKTKVKCYYEKDIERYKPNELVFYKASPLSPKWVYAKIVKRISAYVYRIKLAHGNTRSAHGSQLKPIKRKNTFSFHFIPGRDSPDKTTIEPSTSNEPISSRLRPRHLLKDPNRYQ